MATYVEYSANTSKYEAAMAQMEGVSEKTLNFVKQNWLGLGTAMGLAYKIMGDFNEALTVADNLNKLSKSTGIATEELSAYKYAAELSGVSIDETAKGLQRLSRLMADAAGGTATAMRGFELLGVAVKDSAGQLRPLDDVMKEIAEKFSRMPDGTTKTALAMEFFGRSGANLIPMLDEGAEGLNRMKNEAERLGLIVSSKTAQAAENFNDNLARLGKLAKGSANILMTTLLPGLEAVTKAVTDALGVTGDFMKKNMIADLQRMEKQLERLHKNYEATAYADVGYSAVEEEVRERTIRELTARIKLQKATLASMEAKEKAGPKTPLSLAIPEDWGKEKKAAGPNRELEALNKDLERMRLKEFEDLAKQEWDIWNAKEADMTESLYEYRQRQLEMETGFSQKKLELMQTEHDVQLQLNQMTAQEEERIAKRREEMTQSATQAMIENWMYAFQYFGQKNKAAFAAFKAVAIAQTIVDTYKAAQGAYAAMAGIPIVGPALGVAAAAAAIAAGMARVSSIASTEPGGGMGGGGGGGGGGGSVGVYSASPTTGLPTGYPMGGEDTGKQSLTINIQGDYIGDEGYVEMLAEKISAAVEDRDVRLVSSNSKFADRLA